MKGIKMQTNPTTSQPAHFVQEPAAPAEKSDAAQKLQHARQRIRFAQRSVTASEGRLLDFDTAEDINRALAAVSRDLEEVQITVAVMERRARR
jgi:hypothetical protein